jgi:allophycocyanin alpha subunit
MSILMKLIVNADAEVRYLTPGELEQIKSFVMNGERRLRLAQSLTQSRERIVKQSANQLFQKRPDVVSPGGNAYGEEMTATCLRDMDYYLRLISYSVVAGDTTPIQEIGVIGVREMYSSLGTPIEAVTESIRAMKNVATSMMSGEDASEVGAYFDYLIGTMQ